MTQHILINYPDNCHFGIYFWYTDQPINTKNPPSQKLLLTNNDFRTETRYWYRTVLNHQSH